MAASYESARRWLYGHRQKGMKFGLERMRAAAAARGRPDRGQAFVHVAGTNGKGSTCAFIERALRAAGYRTGWFSSPHLHRLGERFRVNGRAMGDAELARRIEALRAADLDLTFFEYSVLLAFETFRDKGCDVSVLEVGLGGRLDATNIIDASAVSVVTEIGLDHTAILGTTRKAIAREKGGIFRKGGRAVIGATGDAAETLHGLARRKKMGVRRLGHDFDVQPGVGLSVDDARYAPRLGLRGEHQWQNAATAVAALHSLRDAGFDVPNHAIETGLRLARWAGRLERRRVRGVEWIFDGAHNPSAAEALGKHLAQLSPKRTVLLFGALGDKDHEGLLRPLDSHADERVYALPKVPRAADLRALARRFPGRVARSVRDGLRLAEAKAGAGGRVVVSGSLFLVADARAKLLGLRADPI